MVTNSPPLEILSRITGRQKKKDKAHTVMPTEFAWFPKLSQNTYEVTSALSQLTSFAHALIQAGGKVSVRLFIVFMIGGFSDQPGTRSLKNGEATITVCHVCQLSSVELTMEKLPFHFLAIPLLSFLLALPFLFVHRTNSLVKGKRGAL